MGIPRIPALLYIAGEQNLESFNPVDIISILELGMTELKKCPVFMEGILEYLFAGNKKKIL